MMTLTCPTHGVTASRLSATMFTPCMPALDAAITYKVADTECERADAFRLVYDAYVDLGLMEPNFYQMRVMPHHLLPTTAVFVAKRGERVIATLSLIGDGRLGLPMESVYGDEVADLRDPSCWLGEVSALATSPTDVDADFEVVMNLMRLMAQFSRRHGLDHLLAAMHPRHARFYIRRLGFKFLGDQKPYPAVRNRPAVAVHLDLSQLEDDPPACYDLFFGELIREDHLRFSPISAAERRHFAPAAAYGVGQIEVSMLGQSLACA